MNNSPLLTAGVALKSPSSVSKRFRPNSVNSSPGFRTKNSPERVT